MVVAGDDDAVTLLHAESGEAGGGRVRAGLDVEERGPRDAVFFESAEGERVLVTLRHLIDERRERVVRLERLELLLVALVHPRDDALLHRRHVLVHPVVGPVDLLRSPVERLALLGQQARVGRARVRARERALLVPGEGREETDDVIDLLFRARGALERARRGTRDGLRRSGRLLEHLRHRLRRTRHRARAERVEPLLRDDRGLHVLLEEVDERVPLAAPLVVLALVERDELAEALARGGVHVARAVLVDGLGRALEELGEREDHAGADDVRGDEVEDGVTPDDLVVALHREEDDRRRRADALVPAGEGETDRALAAGRTRDRVRDPGARDDLLADALRVRVDVRPAPVGGALEAGLDEAVRHVLALDALELLFERRTDGGLASAREVLGGALEELALAERILAAALRLRDQVEAVGDLALRIPDVASELFGAREGVLLAGLLLEDEAFAVTDDVARRRVHQRRVAERLRERDEVLRPERVRIERLVERRVEVDDARDVHDGVDRALQVLHVDAAEREPDVAVDRNDLLLQERGQPVAVDLAERIERLARRDRVPEALFARLLRALPDQEENLPDLRIAMEEEDPEDLAEESGPTEDEEPCPVELRPDIERGDRGGGRAAPVLLFADDSRTVGSVVLHGGLRPYRTR